MRNIPRKKQKAFTLIESMIVLFIIGLLSAVAGVGYGVASRAKKIEQAGRNITSVLDATRDYAVFGQEVDGKFPCGYGLILNKDQANKIGKIYTSGAVSVDGASVDLTREAAMEKDVTCDELIDSALNNNQIVNFSVSSSNNLSAGNNNLVVTELNHINGSSNESPNCVVVLFSAPRGASYYLSSPASCPVGTSGSGLFSLLSEDNQYLGDFGSNHIIGDTNYFLTKLKITEGFVSTEGCHKIYPSGNGVMLGECP